MHHHTENASSLFSLLLSCLLLCRLLFSLCLCLLSVFSLSLVSVSLSLYVCLRVMLRWCCVCCVCWEKRRENVCTCKTPSVSRFKTSPCVPAPRTRSRFLQSFALPVEAAQLLLFLVKLRGEPAVRWFGWSSAQNPSTTNDLHVSIATSLHQSSLLTLRFSCLVHVFQVQTPLSD